MKLLAWYQMLCNALFQSYLYRIPNVVFYFEYKTLYWYVHWKTIMHAPTWQVTSVQTLNLHHWRSFNVNIIGLIVFNCVVIYSSSLHSSLIIFNYWKSATISAISVLRADNRPVTNSKVSKNICHLSYLCLIKSSVYCHLVVNE